jgi:farnesyl-diphosphate farnesyltransferase
MRFLPAAMREPVSLGYLLARFTDTIADADGLALDRRLAWLDETRLVIQGERETCSEDLDGAAGDLSHPGERELVRRRDELFSWYRSIDEANRSHLGEVILTIIQGQRWDATYFPESGTRACETEEDLLRYTYWVAGCVGEFWTKVGYTTLGERFADPAGTHEMLVRGRKLGQALQLINILRDLHEDLPAGRCYLPAEELRTAGWKGEEIPTAGQVEPVFDRWLGVCEGLLEEADAYVREVGDFRVRFCTRLPKRIRRRAQPPPADSTSPPPPYLPGKRHRFRGRVPRILHLPGLELPSGNVSCHSLNHGVPIWQAG